MVAFSFTGDLPQFKALIASAQLRNRFNDLKDYLLVLNALGLTFPSSVASAAQYQALLLNSAKTGFDFSHVVRASGAINLTTTSLANGDMLYYDGSNLVRIAAGTSGFILRSNGAGAPTWVSNSAPGAWENKTSGFTAASNGRYICTAGISIVLPVTPTAGTEFTIKPRTGQNLTSSSITVEGNPEIIAGAAADYICNINAEYHFVYDANSQWDVTVSPIGRA